MEHPQSNGQVKAANKVILQGLKKRLDQAKGKWTKELHSVLWAYHTTTQSTTNKTPSRLTFGSEAMILVEVSESSWRRMNFTEDRNVQDRRTDLDLLLEDRELAYIRSEAIKQRIARKYNAKVVTQIFKKGDLVLRRIEKQSDMKLATNWDGPFRVYESLGNEAYRLAELSGKEIPPTWSAVKLRRYYS